MLKYGPTFVRSLVLVWLTTWVLADPLFLLQEFTAPEEYSAAHNAIRNDPLGKHLAQHYLDVRISSSTEGNSKRGEDIQSDRSVSVGSVDLRRFDRAQPVTQTVALQHWLPFSTSTAPRAPPSASL
jgi:hypothetical protein